MHRDNHYEAAFEAFLRERRFAYIAVDEARRSLVANGSLKSLDFVVSPPGRMSWLVDVKGRRFPSGDERHQYWKNWSTRDDLRSLSAWQEYFGPDFCPLLVFAYHLVAGRSPLPREQLFEFRGEHYGFIGVRLADYVPHARPLSDSWDTVAMPTGLFRRAARPVDDWLTGPLPVAPITTADWHELPANLEWEA
ncbi:MAG TPA: HYExAFE family protein [Lacipirellulaceae bacterium]|nr:HYExAFE family protein [Lacipirellulaceae bacterium]